MNRYRVRVVPRVRSRGWIGAAIGLGGVVGIANALLVQFILVGIIVGLAFTNSHAAVPFAILGIWGLPAIVGIWAGWIVARWRTRWTDSLLIGAAFGAALGVSSMLLAPTFPDSMIPFQLSTVSGATEFARKLLVSTSVMAAAAAALFCIVTLAARSIRGRVIEQTGRRCWRCAYDLGSDAIVRCPECGADFDDLARRRGRTSRTVRTVGACGGIAGGLLLLAAMVSLANLGWQAAPYIGLSRVLGPASKPCGIFDRSDPMHQRPAYYVLHPRASRRAVAAVLGTDASSETTVTLIVIGAPMSGGMGGDVASQISPRVEILLTSQQSQRALAAGVPVSLIEAMFAWISSNTTYDMESEPPRPPVNIDPMPYFDDAK